MNAPAKLSSALALRLHLHANGYEPIAAVGKRPVSKSWQSKLISHDTLADEAQEYPEAENTGLRTGKLVAIDNDIREPTHAAVIQSIVLEKLGDTLAQRRGAKPEPLSLYRCDTEINKITIRARAPGSDKFKNVFEVLGRGQQFIAYGTHPETGQPYRWINDDLGGEPEQCAFEALPIVSPSQVRECVSAVKAMLNELGYTGISLHDFGRLGLPGEAKPRQAPATHAPVTVPLVEAMLRTIPPWCDRATWLTVCGGLGDAPFNDPKRDGLDLFVGWSQGELHDGCPENFVSAEDCEKEWRRDQERRAIGEPVPGFGALVNLAREHGYTGPSSSQSVLNEFNSYRSAQEPAWKAELAQKYAYTLRDPVSDASRPPITYRDAAHLWPDSPGGTVTQLIAGAKNHKTNFILAEMFRLMLRGARVLIVPLEGQYGVTTRRIPALADYYGSDLERICGDQSRLEYLRGRFQVASVPGFALDDNASVDALVASANKWADEIGLGGWTDLVIDTQHRAAGGLEENSATDARRLWNAVERIRRGIKRDGDKLCNVTLLHHKGKDETKGGRGSSADEAAVDQLLELKSDKTTRTAVVTVRARKDGEDAIKAHLQIVSAGSDAVPVLVPLSGEQYRQLSRVDDAYAEGKIGAALSDLKAFGEAHAVKTNEIAAALLGLWGDLSKDKAQRKKKEKSVSARLAEKVRAGRFQAYLVRAGGEPVKPYQWYLPEDIENEAADDSPET